MDVQENLRRENERIILEGLREEIKDNLQIIKQVREGEGYYKNSEAFTIGRFKTYFLEKSLSVVDNSSLRREIMDLSNNIKQSNEVMDRIFGDNFKFYSKEENKVYMQKKNEWIDVLMKSFNYIDYSLNSIDSYLKGKGIQTSLC